MVLSETGARILLFLHTAWKRAGFANLPVSGTLSCRGTVLQQAHCMGHTRTLTLREKALDKVGQAQ